MRYRLIPALVALAASALYVPHISATSSTLVTTKVMRPSGREPDNYSRLIIQFKSTGSTRAFSSSRYAAQSHIADIATISGLSKPSTGERVHLDYVRPSTTLRHVVKTDVAMGHDELAAVARQIAQQPDVEYAEVDEKAYPSFTPNDYYYSDSGMWGMKSPATALGGANFEAAWNRTVNSTGATLNGAGVTVAVIDTGYRPHADLTCNILPGYDFISEDSPGVFTKANDGNGRDADATDPGDCTSTAPNCSTGSTWHGTHVSGIIAAVGNNNKGVIGGAYGARILPVRVLGVDGGWYSDIIDGIEWSIGNSVSGVPVNPNPAKVLNLSLGGDGSCGATLQTAINHATAAGTSVVVVTGNEGTTSISNKWPANCTGVIAVTAHSSLGGSPTWANVGTGTTISAPGVSILSTYNDGHFSYGNDAYASESGTSMAAPHVSAAIALMLQAQPSLTPAQIKTALQTTASSFPSGSYCGNHPLLCGSGLLNVDAAIASLGTTTSDPTLVVPEFTQVCAGSVAPAPPPSGGGGGGALSWLDAAYAALCALIALGGWASRRPRLSA